MKQPRNNQGHKNNHQQCSQQVKIYAEGLSIEKLAVAQLCPYHVRSEAKTLIYAENGLFCMRPPTLTRCILQDGSLQKIENAWKKVSLLVDTSRFDEVPAYQFHCQHMVQCLELRMYQWSSHDPITLVIELNALTLHVQECFWTARQGTVQDASVQECMAHWLQFFADNHWL